MKQIKIDDPGDLMDIPTTEEMKSDTGLVILFDDVDTMSKEIAEHIAEYQRDLLETARKSNISVISTSHGLKRYNKTRTNLEEAEHVVLFPSSNQMFSERFLKDDMGILKSERMRIIEKAANTHYMIIKVSNPTAVIHERGIILL